MLTQVYFLGTDNILTAYFAGHDWAAAWAGDGQNIVASQCITNDVLSGDYMIQRIPMKWDTSTLTGKYIVSAFISMKKYPATDMEYDETLVIVEGTGCLNDKDDYQKLKAFTTSFGTLSWTVWNAASTGDWISIPLNAAGLAHINTTGTSYFGGRVLSDINGVMPTVNHRNAFKFYGTSGDTNGARLWVTYSDTPPAPSKIIEMAFDQPIFSSTEAATWTDISEDVMFLNTKRGRMHELDRVEAGTAIITVDNSDGDYWRYNSSGTFYADASTDVVKPLTLTRIRAVYDGTYYPIWYGYTESLQPGWVDDRGDKNPIMTLECVDFFKSFTRYYLTAPTTGNALFSSELSGTRINNVLDEIGFPSTMRSIDTGQITVAALYPPDGGTNAMEHLFKVADAETGVIFISPSGSFVFQDKNARQFSPYTSSSATFDAVS